jgi:hypothetical protein
MLRSVLHGLAARLVRRAPAGRWPAVGRAAAAELGWAAAAVVVFVAILSLPHYVATDQPDAGWAQLLTHLQTRGAQAGVDFVFPYGPLHQLLLAAYDPGLFAFKYAAEVAFKLATTLLLVRLARQMAPPAGAGFLAGVAGVGLALGMTQELVTLAALAAAWLPVLKDRLTWADAVLGPAYLAAVGLAKFTLVGLGVGGLAVTTVFLLTRRPRWHAAVPFAAYAAAAPILAAAAGQAVANLPAYYRSGLAYAAAYGEGMAVEGPRAEVRLAWLWAGCCLAAILPGLRAAVRDARAAAGLALFALAAGLAWKLGFVRHDGHALVAFAIALFLPAFVHLALPDVLGSPVRRGLLWAATATAGVGCYEVAAREPGVMATLSHSLLDHWKARADHLLHPTALRQGMDAMTADLKRRYDLPAVRSRVGAERIDMLTESQGVALLNGLNLAPRPTLQSVNAAEAGMLRANAAYFAGPAAPPFVLVRWQSFDNRYPTLTDGPALLELLRRYRPALEENGYLLLEKRADPVDPEGQVVADRTVALDEVVPVPPAAAGGYHTLAVDVEYTPAGRVRMAALRPPTVALCVRDEAGKWTAYRLVPGMARCEFLLDPVCPGNPELLALWEGRPGRRVTAVRLFVEGSQRVYVRPTIGVTVRAYPKLPD